MSTPTATEKATVAEKLTVALIGNPNTGKSTLFNALVGTKARVGNYPGVTVEKKVGKVRLGDVEVSLIDLPGTYSLSPKSLDEMVSVDVLLGRQKDVGQVDAVICIADASNLERNLYLFSQVLDLCVPTVLVLNMWDIACKRGITIDVPALQESLGVPVIIAEAHRRRGLDQMQDALRRLGACTSPQCFDHFPDEFYAELDKLRDQLKAWNSPIPPRYLLERMVLDAGGEVEKEFSQAASAELPEYLAALRTRLAAVGCRVPMIEAKVRYNWVRETLTGIFTRCADTQMTGSDRIDKVLTNRVGGLLVFAALMFVIFQAIYRWAGPFMDWIETGQTFVADYVTGVLPAGALRSLLIDGVIAGVGGVLVFLPQIVLLFMFIAILEDCGYMARAAFLMDGVMTRLGLSGKSFVPLMSSFACAIPGVMATRVIENRRDRMVTILVAPLMSCSARLPVYLLLIGAFIPDTKYLNGWITLQGLVLFGISSLGLVVAIPVAWLLKRFWFRGDTPSFVVELPSYKWPLPRTIFYRAYDRGKAFVTQAGTLIFCTTILVWAAGYFPGDHTELNRLQTQIDSVQADSTIPDAQKEETLETLQQQHNQLSGQVVSASILGKMGRAIEPVVRPLGWDWRIGVGVISSFPAREVIIATMGTIYSLGGDVDEEDTGLMGALHEARWPDGRLIYNVPVALSIMVFFALCAQCAATLMVIRRETNSWLWPAFTFTYMTALAYVGALITYQVGMHFI